MRIAVIADTHDRLPDPVCEAIRGADEIWHLGDVCSPVIVARLERIAPLRLVLG
ncbi:MAG: metallophosphoesterase family protein, partial [Chthoniobacteraceae bacterium]